MNMNKSSRAESGAATPTESKVLSGGQGVFYAVINGMLSLLCVGFLLRMVLEAKTYWKTVMLDTSTKLGSFTGTAIVLLIPTVWLCFALNRRKWRQVCVALMLLVLYASYGGDIYRSKWQQAKAQYAAYSALLKSIPEHVGNQTLFDTGPITAESFGPFVHIATVLAEQINRQIVAALVLEREITACGLDDQLFAPETLATPEAVTTMRRKLARCVRVVKKQRGLQQDLDREFLDAALAAEAPPEFKTAYIAEMRERRQKIEERNAKLMNALENMVVSCKALYDYMDTQQGNYSVNGGELEFNEPATEIEYFRLLDEAGIRSNKYLQLCQQHLEGMT